ncbi:MAG TPA: hypothetical protein VNA21_00790 [Steroidobacteraceae bacterium]|nr:hypothetical protein [Steroidobacteraceae bacterium]
MKFHRAALLAASMASLTAPGLVYAGCSHQTDITNNSNVTLRFVELKASYVAPFFSSRWTGFLAIQPGDTRTISWTSDLDCTDDAGVPNHWDIKLIRSIGSTHYCGHLEQSESVEVDAPDLCF